MKIALNLLLLLVAASLGLTLGLALRGRVVSRDTARRNETSISSEAAQTKSPGSSRRSNRVGASDDSPLATKLEHDLSISKGVTHWLLWLQALEKAHPSDFPRLARLAQGKPAAIRFLAARWVEIAPRHLYDALVAAVKNGGSFPVRELSDALFDQWPKKNPE